MGSKHSKRRTFSEDFILTLLREYYSSEVSINFICRKYDICSAIEQSQGMDLSLMTHHSDRGGQYCSNAYVARLESIHSCISMTEDYNPTDNAIAERVNGIIKQEWLYHMKRPKNIDDARCIIAGIIDFYNNKRLHMSNGMLTPRQMRERHCNAA
ncbi:integrase core domain-containing protein [Prevotella melaninogenica]